MENIDKPSVDTAAEAETGVGILDMFNY